MFDTRYQIFISSTFDDLKEARKKVIETILNMYHIPVGMEMFSADDDEQWQVIKDTIDLSDYYIVILGHRYGSLTAEGISFTEKEYDYAVESGIPVLVFVRDRDIPISEKDRESDLKKIKKLKAFIEKATKNRQRDNWKNPDDLATNISVSLGKYIIKNPRIGWIRANRGMTPEVASEMAKLSEENRNLREDISLLKDKIEKPKPIIDILINDAKRLVIPFKKNSKMVLDTPPGPVELNFADYPSKIVFEEIPESLLKYISKEEIEEYNSKLPDKNTVDEYNNLLEAYWRVQETSKEICISAVNNGSAKATDINIEISFPLEFFFFTKKQVDEIDFPESPIPEHPVSKARNKYNKAQNKTFLTVGTGFGTIRNIPKIYIPNSDILFGHTNKPSIDLDNIFGLHIEKNKVIFKVENLLHTKTYKSNNFYIVPIKKGKFNFEASVICEEYTKRETFGFEIEVT